jgi:CRISPR system Cascade subunit CasC
MFVEIHLIQNFAPANLNRDDTGSPKDCEFGGHRRARVSSQCWKRSVREYFSQEALLPESQLGVRTKRLAGKIAAKLMELDGSRSPEQASNVAALAVEALGTKLDANSKKDDKRTSVLLFLGNDQVDGLAKLCDEQWVVLMEASTKKKAEISKEVAKQFREALKGSRAVDLALFGRMIAEDPEKNVDAACQVAHAISTHRVAPEFDYYTAVDDLGRDDETGAGMIGTQEFNSACFYRYANVSVPQLEANLQGDRELAISGLRAFLQSFILAIPKAKQNGTAAQSLPCFVMVVVRGKGLASMANAFARPVDGRDGGLTLNSVNALARHYAKLTQMYGGSGVKMARFATMEDADFQPLLDAGVNRAQNVEELLDGALAAVTEKQP